MKVNRNISKQIELTKVHRKKSSFNPASCEWWGHLSRLLRGSLEVCLDFVVGMIDHFSDRLFEDGGCLSDGQRRVQIWLPLQTDTHLQNTQPEVHQDPNDENLPLLSHFNRKILEGFRTERYSKQEMLLWCKRTNKHFSQYISPQSTLVHYCINRLYTACCWSLFREFWGNICQGLSFTRPGVIHGFCERALTLPWCAVFTWAYDFERAWAVRSIVCMPCFMLECGVRIPALMSWVLVLWRSSDTRSPWSVSLCECAVSSSLGRALFCPRVFCGVWHTACVFHWLLVWTRGLWIFSLSACLRPVLHMAGDLFAGHVLVFCFVWAHGFCLSFLCAVCSPVNLSWPHPSCFLIIG